MINSLLWNGNEIVQNGEDGIILLIIISFTENLIIRIFFEHFNYENVIKSCGRPMELPFDQKIDFGPFLFQVGISRYSFLDLIAKHKKAYVVRSKTQLQYDYICYWGFF